MAETQDQTTNVTSTYQKHLERIIASLIQKYDLLDARSEVYKDDIMVYMKLIDGLTKVSAHLRDFMRMAGIRIEGENDLALLFAKVRESINEK
ncbi:MAG: hypothetical protein ACRD32_07170 [Nitrososphaerales archaeon]